MARKSLTPEQIQAKAHKLIVDLHKLRVVLSPGNLTMNDLALLHAMVNAETHLAMLFPAKKK